MTYLMPAAFAAMLVAALALPTTADRLRGALGLPAYALGAASLPYLPGFRGPSVTVWISAALLLLGPVMLLVAAWRAGEPLRRHWGPLLVVLLGVAAGCTAAWPTLDSGGVFPGLVTTAAVASACLLIWMVSSALSLGRGVRWLDARIPSRPGGYSWGTPLLAAGTMAVYLAYLARPLWVLSWQPIGVGVAVLAAWWAAATGRAPMAAASVAFAAAFCTVEAVPAGWLFLLTGALAYRTHPRVAAVAIAAGGLLTAPALLDAEVLFTVLLTGAATALVAVLAMAPDAEVGSR
ncbi:MAG TPA: hypothetical protein P5319_12715 [Gemmatimonadales bacterium]|nr:hypothetical protein [Gemmatimonadales bacterium]